ncbi:hypothetical protein K470DRAFT_15097 [Piedraia hortae CBS 480.64]|uniref:Pericentrin/AKAP-450 centrosomal targeting domain-containing protein n=1 Tax=Piedraia hortae CBS 480.64 TaxID=1314780 RepID=A0A6A7C503_9PEZI|nr:hypothetical protein K470DRAFT_15097 [Piedraia hortae CBS 480.64]
MPGLQMLAFKRKTLNYRSGMRSCGPRRPSSARASTQTRTDQLEHDFARIKLDLQDEIVVLEAAVDEMTTEKGSLEDKVRDLESQLHQFKVNGTPVRERDNLQHKLATSHSTIEALKTSIKTLEASVESTTRERDSLQHKLQTSHSDLEALKSSIQTLETEVISITADRDSLQQNLSTAEANHTALRSTIEKLEITALQPPKPQDSVKLRTRIENLKSDLQHEKSLAEQRLAALQARHEAELKGLAKQIQFLRAKCTREENFRADLAFSKKFFLLQIELYNKCNQTDLRLLEEMGITPDMTVLTEQRPSLRSVGLMVISCIRMKRLQQSWAANARVQEALIRKLDAMRRQRVRA